MWAHMLEHDPDGWEVLTPTIGAPRFPKPAKDVQHPLSTETWAIARRARNVYLETEGND